MPILASDAYPGKQITTPANYAKSKKSSAIMFAKADSATLIRQTQSTNTLSPSTKTIKEAKKVAKQPRKKLTEMRELKELRELQLREDIREVPWVTSDELLEISEIQQNNSDELEFCLSRESHQITLFRESKESHECISDYKKSGQATPSVLPPMNLVSIRNSVHQQLKPKQADLLKAGSRSKNQMVPLPLCKV